MFAVLGGVTLIAHIYSLNGIKSRTVGDGQHGTARWANRSEIRKTYKHVPFASDLSLSRSTVKRAIKDLENAGMIRKEAHYRENGSATSNRYHLLLCPQKESSG